MSYLRLPYADADTAATMHRDCGAVAGLMHLDRPQSPQWARRSTARARVASGEPAPVRTELTVNDTTARLAAALHLHLN